VEVESGDELAFWFPATDNSLGDILPIKREFSDGVPTMTTLITDPSLEQRLKDQRQAWGADLYDEVWEGITMMAPMPNDEHQQMVSRLGFILESIVGYPGLGEVRPGVNLSDREGDWEHDYRVPDVAVFLRGGSAENCGTHWRGAADFLVEITSPGDRTREKLAFYSRLGVRELLIVDRQSWTLELLRFQAGQLQFVGQSRQDDNAVLASAVMPLRFQLVAGQARPQIQVTHAADGRCWLV
jgi:Uma2 family endonuclease